MTKIYTGIGSRSTPGPILELMKTVGGRLGEEGWTLRSGGAQGADRAFEDGARAVGGSMEIFIPWSSFHPRPEECLVGVTDTAIRMALETHPAPEKLSAAAKLLHGRNCYQVLGEDLGTPTRLILCWTPDGAVAGEECTIQTGGTATAIRLASTHGIPVLNLAREDHLQRLLSWVE